MTAVRNRPRADDYRGFTLPELVFVLSFIGVAIVVFVSASSFVKRSECTPHNSVKSVVSILEEATNMYVLNIGSCPTAKQGLDALVVPPADLADPTKWMGPYLQKPAVPLDAWNNPYHYQALGGGRFRIWSSGPNGKNEQCRGDDIATSL